MGRALAIIVTYNSASELEHESVRLEEIARDPDFDLLFIDNNSSDGSAEICRNIRGALVLANESNIGFAKAVNNGLALLDGQEYFTLLNPDLTVSVSALKGVIDYLDANTDVAVCTPVISKQDGTPQGFWASRSSDLPSMLVNDFSLGAYKLVGPLRRRYGWLNQSDLRPGAEPGFISGACFTARSRLLDEIGLLDERYFLYYEETDWCRRAIEAGYRLGIATDVTATHEIYGSAGGDKGASRRIYYESRYKYLRKFYGRPGEYVIRGADLLSGLIMIILAPMVKLIIGRKRTAVLEEALFEARIKLRSSIRK